jgi:hypothetical protein
MPTPTRSEHARLQREERAREREARRAGASRRGGGQPPRRRGPWLRGAAIAAGALAFGAVCGYALRDAGLQLATTGPPRDAHLSAASTEELRFRIIADLPSLMDTAALEYDGADVLDEAHIADGTLTYRPRDLSDGTHRLSFSIDQPFGFGRARRAWTFTVDRVRPRIEITGPERPAVRGAPVTLTGRVDEAAAVTVEDAPVDVGRDGSFSVDFPEPPAGAVRVRAVDLAGNSRGIRTSIPIAPRTPLVPTRAVHMTAISWATDSLREPVLDMLRSGRINTVELDLKDESGVVGYDSKLTIANRIGAVQGHYRLADAVREIHDLGGRVVGRVVAFRDPVLAAYAWDHGDREQVIQSRGGGLYQGYGGFTNFADPVVRRYNIDVAVEAARAGVDDILYDYIRRPDGPLDTMVFPGLRGGAQSSIVSFLGEARKALDPTGAFLGASVFGIAAFRPEEVAQDVPRMARNADYIAPLIYPSGWGEGSYDVPDPARAPGRITQQSLEHFKELVRGSGARIVPWLQDFSLHGVTYGPREVKAQRAAARAEGIDEWIFWNPNVRYSTQGYPLP